MCCRERRRSYVSTQRSCGGSGGCFLAGMDNHGGFHRTRLAPRTLAAAAFDPGKHPRECRFARSRVNHDCERNVESSLGFEPRRFLNFGMIEEIFAPFFDEAF